MVVAKEWYAERIKHFGDEASTTFVTITTTTKNIEKVDVLQMEAAQKRRETLTPVTLAGYGHAGSTYLLARDRPSRALADDLDVFGKVAGGWFKDKGQQGQQGHVHRRADNLELGD